MTNPNKWREKYLVALDEQEALEKRGLAQSELLRRLVIYLGAAAAGLDPKLDGTLVNLKDKLRGASGTVVHEQMLTLEKVVQEFEEKRQNYHRQTIETLTAITHDLSQLSLSSDILSQLGSFRRQLSKTSFALPLIPEQLTTLARLHALAITESKEPQQGFWQRVRGGQNLKFEGDEQYEAAPPSVESSHPDSVAPKSVEGGLVESEPVESNVGPENDRKPQNSEDDVLFEHRLDQPGWDAVNEDIKIVLDEILDAFKAERQTSVLWQSAKMRLQGDMDWHQLVDTLEDFRDLLDERNEKPDNAISDYLTQVNQELHDICDRLGLSVEAEHKQEVAVDALGKAVTEQMQQMQSMVASSTDLEGLKLDISQHITVIGDALSEFRDKSEAARPISEELEELITKVKTIEAESARTQQLLTQEQHKANHDALTELPNRNAYNNRVLQEWHRFKRYGRPLSIAVCDIDRFKGFNDKYGHQIGDRVLRLIAKSLYKRLRSVDFVARYGGEEFVVLLPETSLDDAFKVLDSARAAIGGAAFRFKDEPVTITFSCGVTSFFESDSIASAFARADEALYKAKEAGRNKTVRLD